MPRRRRSFFFDNINKRLLVNTTKNTKQSKAEKDAGSVTDNDFLKKSEIDSAIDAAVTGLIGGAPGALDTLDELSAALNDDSAFSTTVTNSLANKLESSDLTGYATETYVGQQISAAGSYSDASVDAHLNQSNPTSGYVLSWNGSDYAWIAQPTGFSGAYADLTGKPTIPTNNNQLTNGAGYITTAFINDEGSYTGDLNNLTASSDQGFYHWGSTQPTNTPGWNYGGLFVVRDNNQNIQLAIGNSGNGTQRLAIRRANSGTYNSWTEFWSTRNFSSTDVSNWDTAYGWGNHASAGYSTFSGSYNDLSNKPTIPTNNNQLTNGAGYTTFTANQSLNTTSNVTHAQIIATNWLRTDNAGEGLYNNATGQHFYSAGTSYWHINSGNGLIFYSAYNSTQGNGTNRKGYVYFDGSGFGLLHSGGGWSVRTTSTDTELYNAVKLNSISEAPSEWNPVLLEDGGYIKKDSSVSIHGAGYLKAAYLNMTHGAAADTNRTVFYASTDDYIRKITAAGLIGSLNSTQRSMSTQKWAVASDYGHGIYGVYSSTRYQHVWSMGTAYNLTANGTGVGNLYGISWTHTNVGTGTNQSISGLSHQMQIRAGGNLWSSIGYGIWTASNVTAYSDIAVKENIVKIDNAIDKVKQISGYTFDRIDAKKQREETGEDIPIRQAGVIAQEIEKVLPEVVQGEEGNKSVAYGNVVALLIEAIKEQQEQIEELKERLQ